MKTYIVFRLKNDPSKIEAVRKDLYDMYGFDDVAIFMEEVTAEDSLEAIRIYRDVL